ncbi:hypothetical protein ASF61_06020 [Duganella sp. Leaf126]|nr:hypothetical protein ASF61_06020 [Duganella sp. Leaf126]
MIELITVMLIVGLLGAVAGSRFFDHQVYAARAYADQVAALIRYAQKLAIAQNRPVTVRSTPGGFAVCFDGNATTAPCATPASLAQAPGGANDGSAATRAFCTDRASGRYVSNWACLGSPLSVQVTSSAPRAEMATGGFFVFDAAGRPFNGSDALNGASSFTRLTLNISSGNQRVTLNVEAESGYVF